LLIRDERQRRKLTDIDILADSIRRLGRTPHVATAQWGQY
jgi:hypothetical protein